MPVDSVETAETLDRLIAMPVRQLRDAAHRNQVQRIEKKSVRGVYSARGIIIDQQICEQCCREGDSVTGHQFLQQLG